MITRLLVDKQFYGQKFSRIYWLSPSATVDDSLDPLREYVNKLQDQEEDPTFHNDFAMTTHEKLQNQTGISRVGVHVDRFMTLVLLVRFLRRIRV